MWVLPGHTGEGILGLGVTVNTCGKYHEDSVLKDRTLFGWNERTNDTVWTVLGYPRLFLSPMSL